MKQEMEKERAENEAVENTETNAEANAEAETTAEPPETADAELAEEAATNAEMEALKKTAEEHYQRYLRTQADFDNFRRRARAEKEEFAKYASQKLIEGLLPIVDNFDRAVAASREQRDFEALAKGVEMIQRQLGQLLESEGLKPIEAIGQPFNPELHQAIMQVPAEEGTESGIVVEELQKGYMLKEKVIRPSMVKVTE
ncbi:nucleotide exchange factor GrpE [Paenibacillus sp.]|uniref:nucleotide exchange factor GrpE n=1 Tax=Paenibacillus sp. TaxID=58172 RepID=UPI002D27397C|nr:nucleotide exchange factor GrpE [Paenibacillus sp.]HZG84153.1 nucleotide exchange factor GrpE [Paenibacillus sp.]